MSVSIIIKSLNEERHIAHTIECALRAIDGIEGSEVILADSLSIDRTLEVARRYPIRIVQLQRAEERCCGVGAELGYRMARGDYIYLLDADMEIVVDFLPAAIEFLAKNPDVAGVGGGIEELTITNAEFRGRAQSKALHLQAGEVDRLNGGGLYRRSAIDGARYLTNRNLHAFEEFELAIRLRHAGWRLHRLGQIAVRHSGHHASSLALLAHRWRSRYLWGGGELLREAWGTPGFIAALTGIPLFRKAALMLIIWIAVVVGLVGAYCGASPSWFPAAFILLPVLAASLKRGSLKDGIYVVCLWNLFLLGTIAGARSRRHGDPSQPIQMIIVQD